MRGKMSIVYYHRKSRELMTERVYASGFLSWAYNARLGRLATDLLFRQKFISQLYGWFHKKPFSRWRIKPFVKKMGINNNESIFSLEHFATFNDFFIRQIDPKKRPICNDPDVCIAPVDGKVLAYPIVEPDSTFRIKRSRFNLREFLCDDVLAEKFAGGSMIISRLCLADYHHFHFPDSGIPGKAKSIQGKYYAGGPYALRTLIPFYSENHRMLTLFDSDHFGQMAMVEIGAFTVGSIRQTYQADARASKGSRKGFFELGGSTVVLLFQKKAIELDEDLCENTKNDLETYVRLGDSTGRRCGSFSKRKIQKEEK
jgi:phosphatidylserine decarboxylase